jgi:hypothetical protein
VLSSIVTSAVGAVEDDRGSDVVLLVEGEVSVVPVGREGGLDGEEHFFVFLAAGLQGQD